MVYSTRCKGCHQERRSPEHPFDELDLSIEGVRSVEEALAQYLAVEQLCHENQYECGHCQARRDAERCTMILKTPSVLCLYLMRYGYDRETYERKKLTCEVTFSDHLELQGDKYKLVSVLYHKGRSAYGGHYVCDALDWETSQWWHYDDTSIQATVNPTVETSASSTAEKSLGAEDTASTALPASKITTVIDLNESAHNSPCNSLASTPRRKKVETKSDDGEWIDTSASASKRTPRESAKKQPSAPVSAPADKPAATEGTTSRKRPAAAAASASTDSKASKKRVVEVDLTSDTVESNVKVGVNRKKDAYMLMYVKISDFDTALKSSRCDPSEALLADVNASSIDFLEEVEKYQKCHDALMLEVEERKRTYTSIKASLAPTISLANLKDHKFTLVPTAWLNKWIKGDPSTFKACEGKILRKIPVTTPAAASRSSKDTAPVSVDLTDDGPGEEMQVVDLLSQPEGGGEDGIDEVADLPETSGGSHMSSAGNTVNTMCYLCRHQAGLDTAHIEKFKVISEEASRAIFSSSSPTAWQRMDYEFTHENFRCNDCFDSMVDQRKAVQSQASKNERILQLIDESSSTGPESNDSSTEAMDLEAEAESVGFWISRKWLEQFRKVTTSLQKSDPNSKSKPAAFAKIFSQSNSKAESAAAGNGSGGGEEVNSELPVMCTLDPAVNSNLFCEHKQPASTFMRRAQRLSAAAWEAIRELFPDARPISGLASGCKRCQEDAERAIAATRENKACRGQELEQPALHQLNKMKRIYPAQFEEDPDLIAADPDCARKAFYAVDGMWVAHWRRYISDPNFPSPGPLTNDLLRCNHGNRSYLPGVLSMLEDGVRPSEHDVHDLLVHKFQASDLGEPARRRSSTDAEDFEFAIIENYPKRPPPLPAVELITEAQWLSLLSLHCPAVRSAQSNGTGAHIFDLDNDPLPANNASLSNTDNNDVFTVCFQFDARAKKWAFTPPICTECITAHEEHRTATETVYQNASLPVLFMKDEMDFFKLFNKEAAAPTAAGVGAPSAESQEGVRRSSRTTRGKRTVTSSIIADSTDQLSIVRLKVYEALNLAPGRQKLFDSRGVALDSQVLTLRDYKVKAGDKLYVLETDSTDDEWGFLDCVHTSTSSRGAEHGFGGTLLQRSSHNTTTATTAAGAGTDASGALPILADRVSRSSSSTSLSARHAGTATAGGDTSGKEKDEEEFERELRQAMELSKQEAEDPFRFIDSDTVPALVVTTTATTTSATTTSAAPTPSSSAVNGAAAATAALEAETGSTHRGEDTASGISAYSCDLGSQHNSHGTHSPQHSSSSKSSEAIDPIHEDAAGVSQTLSHH